MYQTFIELIDSVTGCKYMGMKGCTIKSKTRAINKLRGHKGWVVDKNDNDRLVAIEGFGSQYQAVI